MAGAVLSALNIKLDASTLAVILQKLEAKFIFVDYEYVDVILKSLELLPKTMAKRALLVLIQKLDQATTPVENDLAAGTSNSFKYSDLLEMGETDFEVVKLKNDGDPISVGFTSGSTGEPKGVLYSNRAAYLKSLASIKQYDMGFPRCFYGRWTCFGATDGCCTWAMAARGPVVLNMIADAPSSERKPLPCKVHLTVAGVLPMSQAMETLSMQLLSLQRSLLGDLVIEEVEVKEPETMKIVQRDGKTIGEVMFRGNTLSVGGAIISTLEVEAVLLRHPKVMEAAFVGKLDEHLKVKPCAFVKLKEGYGAISCEEIVKFCQGQLPDFMVPQTVVFGELPVNSTGKVQKF
ncbi:putative RPM1-interacting protein 4 family protein [Hibiscus syriacus]|uniref:RPM1-interacting protein 4 family protein n=1 Tax=Hibiscus syriacus TaxID=106335 RepID=A0A6A3ATF3_HIBSY|nr:putative RPM1-interacting protein 4 family protein [Hibiscus syriacus]